MCKQLGFMLGANNITTGSFFGSVNTSTYSYYNVQCVGNETSLHACPHADTYTINSPVGAGVICGKAVT